MEPITDIPRQTLGSRRNSDGGYGPHADRPSTTESTAWAVMALDPGPERERAVAWLLERQLSSGAWPVAPGFPEPSWMSSAALLALADRPDAADAVRRATRWLLQQRSRRFPLSNRLFYRLWPDKVAVQLDIELRAWPWTDGAFAWCEPTAMAMLALGKPNPRLLPGTAAFRRDEGARLLLDRVCEGGGWNYGNTVVLGEELWPYPDTTAITLLALTDRASDPRVGLSVEALHRMLDGGASTLALALGALALGAHGAQVDTLRSRLAEKWRSEPQGVGTRAAALSVLVLEERENPFLPCGVSCLVDARS